MSETINTDFRRPDRTDATLRASVVIAVLDEAENVAAVCDAIYLNIWSAIQLLTIAPRATCFIIGIATQRDQ